jgi:hypothetical protein
MVLQLDEEDLGVVYGGGLDSGGRMMERWGEGRLYKLI